MADPRTLISIATYNESGNLSRLIHEIHAVVPAAHVLVIDDNSPDGTGKIADEMAASDPRIHVLHRPGKLGVGTAIVAGMNYAMAEGYDFLVNIDADFSHHPRYLPALLEGMNQNDIMIGSRYVLGGGTVGWPWKRRFASASVNAMVRFLMRLPARDASGGYRCYRVSKLGDLDLGTLVSHGYSFQEELLQRAVRAGCRIGETPIIFEDRRVGTSKVNLWEITRSMGILFWLGLRSWVGLDSRRPVRAAEPVRPQ